MSHARVRTLFSAALANYAQQKGLEVSYDNVKIEFVGDTYIRSHIIPSDTFSDTLSGDHKGYTGMFQMTIVTKYGTGLLTMESIANDLQNIFLVNKMFTDGKVPIPFNVQVTSPLIVPEGKQSGVAWESPCYFEYRADTN